MHLISDDIYLSLKYVNLPSGPGFSYVRSTPAPANPRLTATLSGNMLHLSWPVAGPRLQAQVNSVGIGVSTNWFDVPG